MNNVVTRPQSASDDQTVGRGSHFSGWRVGRMGETVLRVHWSLTATILLAATVEFVLLSRYDSSMGIWTRVFVTSASLMVLVGSIVGREALQVNMASHHGITIPNLSVWALGGKAHASTPPKYPRAEFQVAGVGLCFNGALAVGLIALSFFLESRNASVTIVAILRSLGWLNTILTGIHLTPVAPLDCGRILTAIFWHRHGSRAVARVKAGRLALICGPLLLLCGGAVVGRSLPLTLLLFTLGAISIFSGRNEVRKATVHRRLETTSAGQIMTCHPVEIQDSATAHELLEKLSKKEKEEVQVVTRWNEPVGFLGAMTAANLGEAERSWTSLGQLMRPLSTVNRSWTNESIADVLKRVDLNDDTVVVVQEPAKAKVVGVISSSQIRSLLHPGG